MKNVLNTLIALLLAVLFNACKKEKTVITQFKWVANKNTFHYDRYTNKSTQKDFRSFGIFSDNYRGYHFLETFNPDSSVQKSYFYENIYGQYVVKTDGLYKLTPTDCGFEDFLSFTFDALFAPNNPVAGQLVPVYFCKNSLYYNINISAVDQTISVPYGTFKTYIMQFKNGDKGYIDPNNGLIMYIAVDSLKKTIDTLKLSTVTNQ
jgi:hypothetical protein